MDPAMWANFKDQLEKTIDHEEDSLRYYF
ncbi:MAG: hypothetical protein GF344_16565 [Chitinivibrionales bacterium]|nr:hypothetical protein [Chitinivibrionales bacterium]MBD3358307.1 hypothetical protein [Chitinivibrionales bacterium]